MQSVQVDRALAAVLGAEHYWTSGQRNLLTRAVGAVITGPGTGDWRYKMFAIAPAFRARSARYIFARERMRAYRDKGFGEREARAATSLDVGHGDKRGRYVANVYARGA
jgi:hypothetical protein